MDDGSRISLGIAGCIGALVIMGLLNACESAAVEVNDSRLKKRAEKDKKAKRLLKLVSKPNRFMTASAVARSFMVIAFAVIAHAGFFIALNKLLADKFSVGRDSVVFCCVRSFISDNYSLLYLCGFNSGNSYSKKDCFPKRGSCRKICL